MSVENHPNFHAVNFTVAIVTAFKESLRGDGKFDAVPPDALHNFVAEMTERAEWLADASAVTAIRGDGGP